MLNNFEQVWQKKFAEQAQAKMECYHTITLASLIEKEAQVPEERAMIAGDTKSLECRYAVAD